MHGCMLYPQQQIWRQYPPELGWGLIERPQVDPWQQPALEQGDKEAASDVEERMMWEGAEQEPIATMEHTMCREAEPEVRKQDKVAASEVEERTLCEAAEEEPDARMEHTMCRVDEPDVRKEDKEAASEVEARCRALEAKMRTADEEARAPARA